MPILKITLLILRRCRLKWIVLQSVAVASLLITGCSTLGGNTYNYHYYTLSYRQSETVNTDSERHLVLKIDPFSISAEYGRNNIMYGKNGFKRNFYPYQKWVASPEKMVAEFLLRDLKQAGIFKAVIGPETLNRTTCLLTGCVEDFYEDQIDTSRFAVLTITIPLFDEKAQMPEERVLFQKMYSNRVKLDKNTPEGLSEAMSQAMATVSKKLISDIESICR